MLKMDLIHCEESAIGKKSSARLLKLLKMVLYCSVCTGSVSSQRGQNQSKESTKINLIISILFFFFCVCVFSVFLFNLN